MPNPNFFIESPQRILKQAQEFRTKFNQTLPMPISNQKYTHVELKADNHLSDINYAIEKAKYQNSIYKKL